MNSKYSGPLPVPDLQNKPLRAPLLVMVFFAIFLSVLAALALIMENRKHVIDSANRENGNIARLVAFHVSHVLDTGVRLLDNAARNVETHGLAFFESEAGKQQLLSWIRGYPELQKILLISKTGQLLVGATLPYPPPSISYADRDYFLQHKLGETLVFGELLVSRSHGRRGTTLSRAIRSASGELEAIVLITIESDHFARLFETVRRSANQEISVFRTDGAIFFRFPELDPGRRFPQLDVFLRAAQAGSGIIESDSEIDGKPRRLAYEKLENFPLIVVVSQPEEEVLHSWQMFSGVTVASLLLALVLLGVASRYAFIIAAKTEALQLELQLLAQTDFLTGLANRRQFMTLAEKELSRTARYGGAVAVFMIDIDHFKKINDSFGHSAGDLVLQHLSRLFQNELREIDILGRLGGEEFAIMLPQIDDKKAVLIAERLRMSIAEASIPLPQGDPVHLTVSIGVSMTEHSEVSVDFLLNQADKALYVAKNSGRNRVVASWLAPSDSGPSI